MTVEEDTVLTPEILAEIDSRSKGDYAPERRSVILMLELCRARADIFLLMRDDNIAKWWSTKINEARKSIASRRERWVTYRYKIAAWDRLTAAERKALGLRKPAAPTVRDPDAVEA